MRWALAAALAGTLCAAGSERAQADDPSAVFNVRLLAHGHKIIGEGPWGVAGWVLAPNVTSAPDRWLGVAGVRYQRDTWWAELMAGAIIQKSGGTPLFDMRAGVSELKPVVFWTNWQWINWIEARHSIVYGFVMVQYVLPDGVALLGVETEDFFIPDKPDRLAVGPNLVIPFGELAFMVSYQFTDGPSDQVWLRLIYNP